MWSHRPPFPLPLLAGSLALAGCGSMTKETLEGRLLALEKNRPIREHGLARTEVAFDVDGTERRLELVYLHLRPEGAGGEDTARAPVVLVHATPSTLCSWVEVVFGGTGFAGLAATREVFALEVVGHGMAPGDVAPYGFGRCADFVAASLRALAREHGFERAHLVGASYGGELAWRAALDAPELVLSLTLLDSSGYARPEDGFLPEERKLREMRLADLGWTLNSKDRVAGALAPHFDALPEGRAEEVFLVCENARNWHAMVDLVRDENGDRADELGGLRPRTLLVWGDRDLAYPVEEYGRRFERDVPGSELVVVEDCGHYPHEERPAEVVRILERFLGSVE